MTRTKKTGNGRPAAGNGRRAMPPKALPVASCLFGLLAACGGGAPATGQSPASAPPPSAQPAEAAEEADAAAVAAVERAVNQYNAAIHACWAKGAADDLRLEGEVALTATVGERGATERVEVAGDTTGDRVLVDCLVALWAAHRWPPDVFAARDEIRLPRFRFGAPEAQHVVSSAHVPRRPLGAAGPAAASTVQVLLHPDNSGNSAAALSLLEMAPGMKVPRHRHAAAELLLIIAGQGRMRAGRVAAGDAIYIAAGAPHELENTGSGPLVAVQLYAPAGPERRFLGQVDPGTQPAAGAEDKGGPAARIASAARARRLAILDGKATAQIAFDAASAADDAASLVALTFQPGALVPRHVHDGSSEYLFLLEGRGVLVVAGQETPVAAGDAIQIPSGIEHGFRAAADADPVKAVQFYAPAGPEQRFKGQPRSEPKRGDRPATDAARQVNK